MTTTALTAGNPRRIVFFESDRNVLHTLYDQRPMIQSRLSDPVLVHSVARVAMRTDIRQDVLQ